MPVSLSKVLISFCDWFKGKLALGKLASLFLCKLAPHYFSKCKLAPHYFSKCNSVLHYFSKCNSALHYFSKCKSAHHYFSKCKSALLFNFSKCKQALIFYSGCKPALIFCSSKYETVSNFCFQNNFMFLYILWIILNMFQMLFLIMYKTSRFWPLV